MGDLMALGTLLLTGTFPMHFMESGEAYLAVLVAQEPANEDFPET